MRHLVSSIILIMTCLFSTQVLAVKILECVDEEGNKTYQDRCPPGTTQAGEKKFYTGKQEEEPTSTAVILYSIPECDACDLVRNLLNKYEADITEKDVKTDITLQRELQDLTGAEGILNVPVTVIGGQTLIGYKKQEMISLLETAGLQSPDTEEETEETEATEETEETDEETVAEETDEEEDIAEQTEEET